jgi:hypothetical protein
MPTSGPERVARERSLPSEEIRKEELRDIMGRARANSPAYHHRSVSRMRSLPSLPILTPQMQDPFGARLMPSLGRERVARESTLPSEEIREEELRDMMESARPATPSYYHRNISRVRSLPPLPTLPSLNQDKFEEFRNIMERGMANSPAYHHMNVALMRQLPSLPILTPQMQDPCGARSMPSLGPERVARESTLPSEEIREEELREMIARYLGNSQISQQTVMSTSEGKFWCIYLITRDVKASVVFIKSRR